MATPGCYSCGHSGRFLFYKLAANGDRYSVLECENCGLWQIDPIPSEETLNQLYEKEYFEKRTDRGYDNYKSEQIRKSVESTFQKNLTDLGFFEWQKTLFERSMLEVGCAGGYFVEYMQNQGWQAEGVEVSPSMAEFAQSRGLNVTLGDFLALDYGEKKYQLIALWATIEHLANAKDFIEKMSTLLAPEGRLIISTCHTGYFARRYKDKWRFLNVPEHIYYFNLRSLKDLFAAAGLKLSKSFTYGSGFTGKADASRLYRFKKKIADWLAKKYHLGDMIVCQYENVKKEQS